MHMHACAQLRRAWKEGRAWMQREVACRDRRGLTITERGRLSCHAMMGRAGRGRAQKHRSFLSNLFRGGGWEQARPWAQPCSLAHVGMPSFAQWIKWWMAASWNRYRVCTRVSHARRCTCTGLTTSLTTSLTTTTSHTTKGVVRAGRGGDECLQRQQCTGGPLGGWAKEQKDKDATAQRERGAATAAAPLQRFQKFTARPTASGARGGRKSALEALHTVCWYREACE